MKIDEGQDVLDLSDHNFIEVELKHAPQLCCKQ